MRKQRHLSPSAELSPSLYHVHSRCVDRSFKFEEGQRGAWIKDKFVQMMREYEALLGVRVQAYCLMSNHFHLLLEVPPKKKGAAVPITDKVFLGKIKAFYSNLYYVDIKQMVERFRKGGSDKAAEELKARFTSRMYDLSEFMKRLKQRFTQWYNKTHDRTGTLWEGRFKSVLVEDGYAARVMSVYIDLNPIRAGMVSRPENYRWSSYGEEVFSSKPESRIEKILVRKGFKRKDVESVLAKGGKLSFGEALRCKIRYLTDGMVFGTRGFVNQVFKGSREHFSENRTTGARPIRGVDWKDEGDRLYSMRALKKEVLK